MPRFRLAILPWLGLFFLCTSPSTMAQSGDAVSIVPVPLAAHPGRDAVFELVLVRGPDSPPGPFWGTFSDPAVSAANPVRFPFVFRVQEDARCRAQPPGAGILDPARSFAGWIYVAQLLPGETLRCRVAVRSQSQAATGDYVAALAFGVTRLTVPVGMTMPGAHAIPLGSSGAAALGLLLSLTGLIALRARPSAE
jgi:hypothetical protein